MLLKDFCSRAQKMDGVKMSDYIDRDLLLAEIKELKNLLGITAAAKLHERIIAAMRSVLL